MSVDSNLLVRPQTSDQVESGYQYETPFANYETSVVHVPMQAPHYPVQYTQQVAQPAAYKPTGGVITGVVGNILGAAVVVLLAIVALVGGYFAAKAYSPSTQEIATRQSIAYQDARLNGRNVGVSHGRAIGRDRAGIMNKYSIMNSKETAYQNGFKAGEKLGRDSYRTRSSYRGGYGRAYRGYSPSYYNDGGLSGALWTAQSIANSTNSVVDVELY